MSCTRPQGAPARAPAPRRPARTDPAIVAKLTTALQQALASPELSRSYVERGFLATYNPPEVVRANMAAETRSWTEVIRQANIRLD